MNDNNKLKGHFVFFGPANVGKSTMIGYIKSHDWDERKFDLEVSKIKEKVGDAFQKRRLYSYFVDKNKDEYRKNSGIGISYGTSKYTHIEDLGDFVLIDTPGGNEYGNERYKGISLANIGIFAIEIPQLLELNNVILNKQVEKYLKTIRDFFSTWFLWKKIHGVSNTIILLTKYDLLNSKEDYKIAFSVLSNIIGKDDIKDVLVIPTSIDIDNRCDCNVFTKYSLECYDGKTLIQCIMEMNNNVESESHLHNYDLLMSYNREYSNVPGVGKVIKWKVNNGTLNINDKILIAPTIINNKFCKVIASIKSMRNEKKEDIQFAKSGDIVNIVLSNIFLEKEEKIVPKDSVQIVNTAIISLSNNIYMGNTIVGKVNIADCTERERFIIERVNQNEQVNILWFSRMLSPNIIICKKDDTLNIYELQLRFENDYIAIPQVFLPKKILLQIKPKNINDLPANFDFNINKIFSDIQSES